MLLLLDHCIELLRQNLMCAADTGVVTAAWVAGYKYAYPDFNTVHQCRNFDKIRQWNLDHGSNVSFRDIVRLGDEVDLPGPP